MNVREKIRTCDLYWAAGFLEGEGYFGGQMARASPMVSVTQVQKEPLERIQKLFGGTFRQGTPNRGRQFWKLEYTASRAVQIMMTLYTLMSPWRQEQIRRALSRWKQARFRRSNDATFCRRGHSLNELNIYVYGTRRKCKRCMYINKLIYNAKRRKGPLPRGTDVAPSTLSLSDLDL